MSRTFAPVVPTGDLAFRLYRRVRPDASGCWCWTGDKTDGGYGRVWQHGIGNTVAHRVSFSLTRGPIPEGKILMHTCDNRACVRPDHLTVGTDKENSEDKHRKGRDRVPVGERQWQAKLTEDSVREIRKLYATGHYKQRVIGEMFGVNQTVVSCVVRRKTWKHVK